MRLALMLFGISYLEDYDNRRYKGCINYKRSLENYKKYIFEYFESKGYTIDVYISTNEVSEEVKKQLIEDYRPIKIITNRFITKKKKRFNVFKNRNFKFKNLINLIDNDNYYDNFLITRFDLLFQIDFKDVNIKLDKLNIVSILEKNKFICDNFYLMSNINFYNFKKIINNKGIFYNSHLLKKNLENNFDINYLFNEFKLVGQLNFYKIVRDNVIVNNSSQCIQNTTPDCINDNTF